MGAKRQAKKSEADIFKRCDATQMVIINNFTLKTSDKSLFFSDDQTIFFKNNNLISQVKSDKNLCKISTFVIMSNDGTDISAELPFSKDHCELIAELLGKHGNLTFAFQDAYGVTLLSHSGIENLRQIF